MASVPPRRRVMNETERSVPSWNSPPWPSLPSTIIYNLLHPTPFRPGHCVEFTTNVLSVACDAHCWRNDLLSCRFPNNAVSEDSGIHPPSHPNTMTAMETESSETVVTKALSSTGPDIDEVVIHPLVLLSVADHYHRVARGTRKRVVGVLLGQSHRGKIDVLNSFALPFEEDIRNPVRWDLDRGGKRQDTALTKRSVSCSLSNTSCCLLTWNLLSFLSLPVSPSSISITTFSRK